MPAVSMILIEVRISCFICARPEKKTFQMSIVDMQILNHRLRKRDAPQRLAEHSHKRRRRRFGKRNRRGISGDKHCAARTFDGFRHDGSSLGGQLHLPRILRCNALLHIVILPN